MLLNEFIERTGYQPGAEEYNEIERAYNSFRGDKDAFCSAWKKANPHKAGKYFAEIKEQERKGKVFENVVNFVKKSKVRREDFYKMNCNEISNFFYNMSDKCKCKNRNELHTMIYKLFEYRAVWRAWDIPKIDLLVMLHSLV